MTRIDDDQSVILVSTAGEELDRVADLFRRGPDVPIDYRTEFELDASLEIAAPEAAPVRDAITPAVVQDVGPSM